MSLLPLWFNASLLKSINFFKKKNTDPKPLNGNVARSISNTKPSGQTYDEQYHTL